MHQIPQPQDRRVQCRDLQSEQTFSQRISRAHRATQRINRNEDKRGRRRQW